MKTLQELLEELKPMLKEDVVSDETKWESISNGVQEVVNGSVKGVIKNKDEILAEKKTLQQRYDELEASLEKVKPFIDNEVSFDQYEQITKEMEEIRQRQENNPDVAKLKSEYFEQGKRTATQELQPKLSEYEKAVEKYKTDQQKMQEKYIETMKRNELSHALNELGVKADNFWLSGFFQSADVEYIETEDRISVSLPHPTDASIGRLPLADWKRIFPQTPEGQRLIPAPRNIGAGAPGSDGKGGHRENLRSQIGSMFGNKK